MSMAERTRRKNSASGFWEPTSSEMNSQGIMEASAEWEKRPRWAEATPLVTMARVRKRPVTAYLLISVFPLVPGAGIYYTMQYAIQGDASRFLSRGMHTLGLSGALALGILLVSTAMRMWQVFRRRRARERS